MHHDLSVPNIWQENKMNNDSSAEGLMNYTMILRTPYVSTHL